MRFFGKRLFPSNPQLNLIAGFFGYTLVGIVILCLPWFHAKDAAIIDNVFTAVSAISTTGLTTITTFENYNLGGQIIILLLIQIGGVGYMTVITYVLLATTDKVSQWHKRVLGAEFELPGDIRVKDFLKNLIFFTLIMETLGAIVLSIEFMSLGQHTGEAIWNGIFHSISAFCTAGFDLFGNSLIDYQSNVLINTTCIILSFGGALGFIAVTDIFYRLARKVDGLTFTSKTVITGIMILLFIGGAVFYFLDSTLTTDAAPSFMRAVFLAVTSVTTVGFTTVDIATLDLSTHLILCILMFIGASPSGTSGGVKITTVITMLASVKSRLQGKKLCTIAGNEISEKRLFLAVSTFTLYIVLLVLGLVLLSYTESVKEILPILFETISALGTVGLSMGITGELSFSGKLIVIFLMFFGRVGLLVFGFSSISSSREDGDK
jgi:trk system potassium uptake protein TrkH